MNSNQSSFITKFTSISTVILLVFILTFTESSFAGSMLWEVRSPTATVYLLGSIHLAKPSLYPLDPVIENSFEKSSRLVLEVNILEINQSALLQKLMSEGMYTDGRTIKDDLSSDVYSLLQEHLKKTGLPMAGFDRMKPGILALTLESLEYIRLGYSPDQGIDMYFARKARDEKPILELESAQEQIDLIVNMPDANLLLKYTILDLSVSEEQLDVITDLWKSGNAGKLNQLLIEDSLREYPELSPVMDEMIFKRNKKMAKKIEGYLATDKTYFVVVGAAHLVGEKSILKYIEDEGLSIQKQ